MDLSVQYLLGASDDPLLLPRTLRTIMNALPDAKAHLSAIGMRHAPRPGRHDTEMTRALQPYFHEYVKERIGMPGHPRRIMQRHWRYHLTPELIAVLKQFRPTPYTMTEGGLDDLGVVWNGIWLLGFVDHERYATWWWSPKEEAALARIGWTRGRPR